jgi:hypothetical protein
MGPSDEELMDLVMSILEVEFHTVSFIEAWERVLKSKGYPTGDPNVRAPAKKMAMIAWKRWRPLDKCTCMGGKNDG